MVFAEHHKDLPPSLWQQRSIMLPRRLRRVSLPIIFVVVSLLVYLTTFTKHIHGSHSGNTHTSHRHKVPLPTPDPHKWSTNLKEVQAFWADLRTILDRHTPTTPILSFDGLPRTKYMDANADHPNGIPPVLDRISYSEPDLEKLKLLHANFVNDMAPLASKLPYIPGSRGIVMSAGGDYVYNALTSIILMRHFGTTLPIELFVNDRAHLEGNLCSSIFPQFNTKCMFFDEAMGEDLELDKFQWKVLTLILSSFQEILFLDADCFPLRDPTFIFEADPFTSHGFISFPDYWLPTVWEGFYAIGNISKPKRVRAAEAGVLFYNKATHAEDLLLASYYNWHGPKYYYPILSQGAHGQGDKETFITAAVVMQKPYYEVRTPIRAVGRWLKDNFEAVGMKQSDPVHDYQLSQEQQKKITKDNIYTVTGKPFNPLRDHVEATELFIHANGWKMDLTMVGNEDATYFWPDEHGNLVRLWGDPTDFINRIGFDVEKEMWRVFIRHSCQNSFLRVCQRLYNYYNTVFQEDIVAELAKETLVPEPELAG